MTELSLQIALGALLFSLVSLVAQVYLYIKGGQCYDYEIPDYEAKAKEIIDVWERTAESEDRIYDRLKEINDEQKSRQNMDKKN